MKKTLQLGSAFLFVSMVIVNYFSIFKIKPNVNSQKKRNNTRVIKRTIII